jgi:putative DNA primase/helicase
LKLKKGAIKKVKSLKEPFEVYKENKQICITSCLDENLFISPKVFLEEAKLWESGVFKDVSASKMVGKSYDLLGFMQRLVFYAQGCFKCYLDENSMHFCLYEAGFWKEGKTYALRFIGDVSQKLKEELNFLDTMEQKKDLIRFINKSFSKRFKEDVLQACISENSLKIDDDTFQNNTGENLLNLNNYTFDFSKNEFREQRKSDFLTYKINLDYDKDSKCEKWKSFLDDVFLGDKELISYVQKLIGYVITGRGNERLFVILNGKGKNGKSVFCDVLIKVLGQYAGTLAKECFIWKKQKTSEINSYLTKALLEKTRFLKTSELASNDVLDDALVKNISGCEDVQTRTLRSLPITMKPQFTIFCLTNNLPRVNDYSKGMWDRIKIIPFKASFGDEVGDKKENKQIRKELYQEAKGILLWCIEGFRKYEAEGLKETTEMKWLVSDYKKEEDVLQQWIDERILFDTKSSAFVKECFSSFGEFLTEQGLNKDDFTQKKFTSQLTKQKGFRVTSDTNTNYKKFRGVKLKNFDVDDDNEQRKSDDFDKDFSFLE